MRTENFVILVHNIFGGPLGSNNERTLTPLQMFLHTAILIGTSGALFILCLCDLHRMLYQRDLVLSVIDLLMLLGIAITVFTIQASALIKYVQKPTESILHYLDDIDGHLYTLSIRHDPAQRLRFNCAACFASAIVLSIGYLLANVLRISRPNAVVFAFKTYGIFVVLLMHGLFLVFSHQILTRVRCMSKHLKKMISTTNTGTEYGSIRLGRDLRTLATVQMQCFRAVNRLNEDCGLPNVTIFGMFFYVLTAKCFQLFYVCSIEFRLHGFQFSHILEPIVLIVAVFSYFFTTTYLGELVLRETQLVINNLHKFESKHSMRPQKTNYSELVEQLGHQILHQPICFTVMNFFQIDFKFFHLVMASVGTYLIILLQFDFQN
ncbi:gustatory and pheromone receptor 32a-like [Anopheles stephensi]|uniref:gustatory and pheromone receptor 32a-like n=1 Tax=Anopheles stephensi TaxID=30069 RepID=UPI001658A889|nr:gustatory and pheromone receptor 32a-like [Anopheles stephensi]